MIGILGILCLFLAFAGAWLAAIWVLGPLDRAAKNRRYPIQFSLADLLCLFVQVQLALAGPSLLFRTMADRTPAIGISVALVAGTLLVWWTGVRTLSRAGVHSTTGRSVTLIVIIPLGYASALVLPCLGMMIFGSLVEPSPETPWTGLMGLVEILLVVLVIILGFMTRRILATADGQRKMAPSAEPVQDSNKAAISPSPPAGSQT
jgi:hypothetical protein